MISASVRRRPAGMRGQLDGQQAFGEVAGEPAGVDGREGDAAPEGEDVEVVVGVQGPLDDPVAGDGLAERVGEPVGDRRDVVEGHDPRGERRRPPTSACSRGGVRSGAGDGSTSETTRRAAVRLGRALLADEGEDRVRDVGDEGGDEPADDEPQAGLVDVEQRPQAVEAAAAGGLGQRGGERRAAEQDRRAGRRGASRRRRRARSGRRRSPRSSTTRRSPARATRRATGSGSVSSAWPSRTVRASVRAGAAGRLAVGVVVEAGEALAQAVAAPERVGDGGAVVGDGVGAAVVAADAAGSGSWRGRRAWRPGTRWRGAARGPRRRRPGRGCPRRVSGSSMSGSSARRCRAGRGWGQPSWVGSSSVGRVEARPLGGGGRRRPAPAARGGGATGERRATRRRPLRRSTGSSGRRRRRAAAVSVTASRRSTSSWTAARVTGAMTRQTGVLRRGRVRRREALRAGVERQLGGPPAAARRRAAAGTMWRCQSRSMRRPLALLGVGAAGAGEADDVALEGLASAVVEEVVPGAQEAGDHRRGAVRGRRPSARRRRRRRLR